MKRIYTSLLCSLISLSLFAQMWNGQDTLYGNEWIDYSKSHYKIQVPQDGIYKISTQTLSDANVPVSSINGSQFQLFYMGQEIPLYTSTSDSFSGDDYIEFYGQKNKSQLDQHLFEKPEDEMLNPYYSLYTDTSAYFLTWTDAPTMRYTEVQNDLTNLPPKEEYFFDVAEKLWTNAFITKRDGNNVSLSNYDMSEGFGSSFSLSRTSALKPRFINTNGPESSITIRYTGELGPHQQKVTIGDNLVDEITSNGYVVQERTYPVPTSELTPTVDVILEGVADNTDKQSISRVHLNYPRLFNFNNVKSYKFVVQESSSKKYLEIENFNTSGTEPILYDVTNGIRLETTFSGSIIQAVLPPSTLERTLVLINALTGSNSIDNITPINFIDYNQQEGDFVFISNKALYDDGQGNNRVQEYADYRSSSLGGEYNTTIIDIQQVYDQFSYGIQRHPISIRNFSHYIDRTWDTPIQYAFIIGKGREFRNTRTTSQLAAAIDQTLFVPTFGFPGSDNLMLSTNSTTKPVFPVGRIPAITPAEIKTYLEKVKTHEANRDLPQTIEDRAWMKRILHLSGGDITIQSAIAGYLRSMEGIIEANQFGADVTTFYKNSADPIQISQSEQIFDLINGGVSVLTFFGHSAVGTFDFNIDNPDNYLNYGKYPMIVSLGCYSGNIHTNGQGISERFNFLEDRGSVAFAASTGVGYTTSLRTFAERYYDLLGGSMYGEGIGDILQSTIDIFENTSSFGILQLAQQFTINGDPSLRLNALPGPDYVVNAQSVGFEPAVINAQLDSLTLNFNIANIGSVSTDSLTIEISRLFPNQSESEILLLKRIPSPGNKTDLSYKLPVNGSRAVGLNKFFIKVDVQNDIEEAPNPAAELNNELINQQGQSGANLYILDNTIQPIYPNKFGIVSTQDIILKATTADLLAPEKTYIFEIDTTELFNSPLRTRKEITQIGGVVKWDPALNYQNEQVYYWRISPDSTDAQVGYVWENSSFVYIEDSPNGWNQSHYDQFTKDRYEFIELEEDTRRFEYVDDFLDFTLRNRIFAQPNVPNGFINGTRWSDFFRWEVNESINIVVFDPQGNIWFNESPGQYGSLNATTTNRIGCFPFPIQTTEERANIINFVENVIPTDHTVIFYSAIRRATFDLNVSDWAQDSVALNGKNIFNVMESVGAQDIRQLENGAVPYIFAFKKNGAVIEEKIADDILGEIQLDYAVPGSWDEGTIQSTLIGPAKNWDQFIWESNEAVADDTTYVNIYGVGEDMLAERLLIQEITDLETPLNTIDTDAYPYLRLEFFTKDVVSKTPTQLTKWRVLYEGIPDAAVNPAAEFSFKNDTLQQGDQLKMEVAIENISDYDMDSLLVKYEITDISNNITTTYQRLAPLENNDTIISLGTIDTKLLSGDHVLFFEINPNKDQTELHSFNNFFLKRFFIDNDKENPLLDVTFDGVHIMNGDIVSSRPNILISLKDENPYLELNDTSLFRVFLTSPNGITESVSFDTDFINFYPASTNNNNEAKIEFNPILLQDGVYELFVQAADVTGNQSGELDYKIKFEIVNKKSISNVLNYPNPFSTSTQFIYTLTGDSPPDFFKIQIFTVSGRVIKEITQDEIGPLKVGTHKTDYTWDGTDTYGDKLANGVYLYRVVTNDTEGEAYEKFDNGTTPFFKRGFGKMVIIR